jgi:hypothetical protein
MFMDIPENRRDTEVHQEWEKEAIARSRAWTQWRLCTWIAGSEAPYVCFKPICDSHLIGEFISRFPDGKHIWVFRNYLDNANSTIRRFPESDRAIRLICEGKPGGVMASRKHFIKSTKKVTGSLFAELIEIRTLVPIVVAA